MRIRADGVLYLLEYFDINVILGFDGTTERGTHGKRSVQRAEKVKHVDKFIFK
jgi:hypothetical protein